MAEHDDDVGLTVGGIAVLELGGTGVGGGDGGAQGEGGQGRGRHEGGQLIGDDADEADAHTADLLDVGTFPAALSSQGRRAGDVGGQDREVRGRQDARLQVGQALVELVVAQGGGIQGHRVERLHGRAVLKDGGDVGRSAHGVSGGDEQSVGVGGAGGGDLAGQGDGAGVLDGGLAGVTVRLGGAGDVAVQVGDPQQVNGPGRGSRVSVSRCRRCGGPGRLIGVGGRGEYEGTEGCQRERADGGAGLDGPHGEQSHVIPCGARDGRGSSAGVPGQRWGGEHVQLYAPALNCAYFSRNQAPPDRSPAAPGTRAQRRHPPPLLRGDGRRRCGCEPGSARYQTMPWAIMTSATRVKPAALAPST